MLSVQLRAGESILAEKNFELIFNRFDGGVFCFELKVLADSPFVVGSFYGEQLAGIATSAQQKLIEIRPNWQLKIRNCEIGCEPVRGGVVKLRILAPQSVRFSRPSQHGTSLRSA